MKILKPLLSLIVAASITTQADACTNIIVGKKASADGSVFLSYNADSYGMYGNVYHHTGRKHLPGEMRIIYDWDTNKLLGSIPQPEVTYTVNGQMNENQVSITETTFGGREELWDTEGIIDYGSLIYIALERSRTAREALDIMTSLVDKYGYCSEGETFSICDKQECWIMEMIGKGKDETGAVWVAVRIPDDCVAAHANQSRITRPSLFAKDQVLMSKDVIKFARKKGYFSGKDEEFSFRDAYAPNDFGAVRYCEARAWSIFNRLCNGMDKYIDYASGKDLKGEMPLYIKPKQPVQLTDVMACMRDHYEDTPFDIRNELGAGPYNMPYRPTPLSWEADSVKYFNERPVSTQQTAFCFVGQMRSQYPDAIGGIAWMTNDDPNMASFTPIFCCTTDMPRCYTMIPGVQDAVTYSMESAFWLQNTVSNTVYPYYDKMMPDLMEHRNHETTYIDEANKLSAELAKQYDALGADEVVYRLTNHSHSVAQTMMADWKSLFEYLMVCHLDMATKKLDDHKDFKMTQHGIPVGASRPGYPEAYRKHIAKEKGERYRMPK